MLEMDACTHRRPMPLGIGRRSAPCAGAIKAPFYQAGISNPLTWSSAELQHPAPWGEIGSSKVVFATPASSLRTVAANPAVVTTFWDKVRRQGQGEQGWPARNTHAKQWCRAICCIARVTFSG